MDIVTSNDAFMIEPHQNRKLTQLLTIYGKVLNSQEYSQSVKNKIKHHLNCLQFDLSYQTSLQSAWSRVRLGLRNNITNHMSNFIP